MPELVKQPMFGGHQPRQQRRVETGSLASFGKHPLDRDEAIVLRGHHQRAIEVQHPATEGAAACVAETGPDFVQRHAEFVIWRATGGGGTDQPPAQLGRFGFCQIAQHPVARLIAGA